MTARDVLTPHPQHAAATAEARSTTCGVATILGVRVHACTAREAVTRIEAMLQSGEQHTIIPVNPEMIMAARRQGEFLEAINAADLALADGTGVLLAARLQRHEACERIPGSDMVEIIAQIAARDGLRVFLLGAAPGVAQEAGRRLQERHRGLIIAGAYAGTPAIAEEEGIRRLITDAGSDILLVAYGAPAQELWVRRNLSRLPVRLAMPVGGTFNFLAGVKARAPRWMQRAGLEWLFRLAQEPRRWRRMLALPRFALLAFTEHLTRRP